MTSSLAKLAEANQKRQLASLIELCDLEKGGVVINDPPPAPVLSEGSEPLSRLLMKSEKSDYTHIADFGAQ